jgi:hypothetical protein
LMKFAKIFFADWIQPGKLTVGERPLPGTQYVVALSFVQVFASG